MSKTTTILVSTVLVALIGCGGGGGAGGGSGAGASTITGKLASGGSGGSTRAYGGVLLGSELHVAAYKLHAKGERGARVDVAVDANGHFRLDVPRGARYVVNVEGADGRSAVLVTFGGAKGVLDVGVAGGGDIDLGSLALTGGLARATALGAGVGAAAAAAGVDEYFEAADGALMAARDAFDAARKATELACTDANKSIAAAQQACTLAGAACGASVDNAKLSADAACAAADAALHDAP